MHIFMHVQKHYGNIYSVNNQSYELVVYQICSEVLMHFISIHKSYYFYSFISGGSLKNRIELISQYINWNYRYGKDMILHTLIY